MDISLDEIGLGEFRADIEEAASDETIETKQQMFLRKLAQIDTELAEKGHSEESRKRALAHIEDLYKQNKLLVLE